MGRERKRGKIGEEIDGGLARNLDDMLYISTGVDTGLIGERNQFHQRRHTALGCFLQLCVKEGTVLSCNLTRGKTVSRAKKPRKWRKHEVRTNLDSAAADGSNGSSSKLNVDG